MQKSVSAVGEGGGSAGGSGSAWESIVVLSGDLLILLASEEVPGGRQLANKTERTRDGDAGVLSPVVFDWKALML